MGSPFSLPLSLPLSPLSASLCLTLPEAATLAVGGRWPAQGSGAVCCAQGSVDSFRCVNDLWIFKVKEAQLTFENETMHLANLAICAAKSPA